MIKSYNSHFLTIVFLHACLLFGSWELSQNEAVRKQVMKLGNSGAIQLKAAGNLLLRSIPLQMKSPPVQKKIAKVAVKKPLPVEAAKVEPQTGSASENTGKSGTGGNPNGSEFGTSSNGVTDALSVYKAELRMIIDRNKYYPTLSKRLGHTGTVVVAFTLQADGLITDVRIDTPSKYEGLDHSALDAVKKIDKFKPIPKEFGMVKMAVKVPVKFLTI